MIVTIQLRVDAFGDPCNETRTLRVRDLGGYVWEGDNPSLFGQVMDPWLRNGSTLAWAPPESGDPEAAFLAFVRSVRKRERYNLRRSMR